MKLSNKTVTRNKSGAQVVPVAKSRVDRNPTNIKPKVTSKVASKPTKITFDGITVTLRPHHGKGMLSKREIVRIFGSPQT